MERVLPLVAGICLGFAALVLNGTELPAPEVLRRASRRLARRGLRLARRLGETPLADVVVSTAVGASLAREVVDWGQARDLEMDERGAAACLVVALALVVIVAAVAFASLVAGLAAAAGVVGALIARDSAAKAKRRREAISEMPGIYRTLSVAMGSGQTLAQAVDYVGANSRGPAASVFSRMSLRLRCGVGTEEAVSSLATELDAPGTGLLATALVISHRTGSPLRDLLLRSARLVERQGEFERMLTVKTAQVSLSVKIVCLLPVVMIVVLALISPDFQEGLVTPSGIVCIAVAALLDTAALLIIRRLVRGVL